MKEEIFEAALADKARLKEIRGEIQLRQAYGVVPPGKSRISAGRFDTNRVWKLMDGAIDFHIHGGPDAYMPTPYDELEIAIQACRVGMKALVFKCHSMSSARTAHFVQDAVNRWAEEHNKRKIDIFGGVVLNYCVGGLNPEAVNVCHRVGGKFVWLPNLDASFHRKVMGTKGGIEVLDENDNIVPPLREIFAMIAEVDMVLSLGHQSTKERFILIDEAKKAGIKRIELIHPNQVTNKMTVDQMKIAADKGAYIGYYCTNFRPLQWSWDEFMQVYQTVGPDRIIAGTDSGIFMSPSPLESMRLYITGMLVRDVPERDVEKMVKTNASTLLY
jgi:hypothetical protein